VKLEKKKKKEEVNWSRWKEGVALEKKLRRGKRRVRGNEGYGDKGVEVERGEEGGSEPPSHQGYQFRRGPSSPAIAMHAGEEMCGPYACFPPRALSSAPSKADDSSSGGSTITIAPSADREKYPRR